MSVEIIEKERIDFSKIDSSDREKFNLWPAEFDATKYHTVRLQKIPKGKVLFFAHIANQCIQAILEFQYNDYDTQLRGFTCGTVMNVYHKQGLGLSEREQSIIDLFDFLQKFRQQEKIRFCLLAVSNWDTILSISAQRKGFNYILTWGKCFYNQDKGFNLPKGYRLSMEKKEKYLPSFLAMTKDYFRGGRFYLDPAMDTSKTDKMYSDLVANCFDSPFYDFIILFNPDDRPIAAFISKKETYSLKINLEVHSIRFLLSDRQNLPRGIAVPFFSETSRILSQQVALVDSGIEMHNLASLKIHNDAGYKFNYIYSAYHSWI